MPSESTVPSSATPAKAPAGPGTGAREKAASAAAESNIKETIESILVAFILAFIFRAFVVEAFVIPTGSMAPTLMGAHMRFRCPDCGYSFDVNFSTGARGDDLQIPDYATGPGGRPIVYGSTPPAIYCPNCGQKIPPQSAEDPDNDGTAPPVYYGDRILVLKYLYLFQKPHRWDVVVFKAPVADPEAGPSGEKTFRYSENYIKRLVGLPGETIMLLDGDVYVKPSGSDAWQIQRKPYSVQKDLWRVVYDNDFIPRSGDDWKQPWTPDGGSGWALTQGNGPSRVFAFHNAGGDGRLTFDATANPRTHALTDWLAYDQADGRGTDSSRDYYYPVTDLNLSCAYQRQSGDGPFSLQLSKGPDTFTARITRGRAQLLHAHDNAPPSVVFDVPVADLDGARPAQLEFVNCDYKVWLRVNGRPAFETTDDQYHPEWPLILKDPKWHDLLSSPDGDWQQRLEDRRTQDELGHPEWMELARRHERPQPGAARILAEQQDARVEHVCLSRDIYYINQGRSPMWGTPGKPIALKDAPNEYFVLGDNSRISGDARMWTDPVHLPAERLDVESGRVPEQFMLGKAFFVYWPAGYRPFSKTFGQNNPNLNPGLIPNFGDMRSIH